jgi:phosphoribosylformylglycinamidine (FGAM) synthase-like enzyme
VASPNQASKKWITSQYDHFVQGNTVLAQPEDSGMIRIDEETGLGVAIATDGNGRYAKLDPYAGAQLALAEAYRNVATTGAKPLAVSDCLNFGSPEDPAVMWQFAEAVGGLADACAALGLPVTGGNVSFYNASGGSAIWPTPVIGMLGLLRDYRLRVPTGFSGGGLTVYLAGETFAELGGSEFAEVVLGRITGRPPGLDLERERALHAFLADAAGDAVLASGHDCSDGGLGVALAEAAILGGHGFAVTLPVELPSHVCLFSESASRAVLGVDPADEDRLLAIAAAHGVPLLRIGETGGPRAMIDGMLETTVDELRDAWELAIPRLLGEAV